MGPRKANFHLLVSQATAPRHNIELAFTSHTKLGIQEHEHAGANQTAGSKIPNKTNKRRVSYSKEFSKLSAQLRLEPIRSINYGCCYTPPRKTLPLYSAPKNITPCTRTVSMFTCTSECLLKRFHPAGQHAIPKLSVKQAHHRYALR